MRYLKICVLSCFLLLPIFVLTASAHAGRTDSNGGHYDRSTGEYHYHHGYPAHDHYDMDGDGSVDCPYGFQDVSVTSSDSSKSANADAGQKYYDGYRKGYDEGYEEGYEYGQKIGNDEGYSSGYEEGFQSGADEKVPSWMLFLSLVILGILFLVNRSLRSNIKEFRQHQEKATKDLNEKDNIIQRLTEDAKAANRSAEEAQKKMRAVQTKTDAMIKAYNFPLIDVPGDVIFSDDGYPILGEATEQRPYGEYTAFIYTHGKVFHMVPNCGNAQNAQTVHLFDVLESRHPCGKCCYRVGIPTKVPKWYKDFCTIRYRKP